MLFFALKMPDFRRAFALCRHMLRNEGVKGFFVGYIATLLRQTLGMSVMLGSYELARDKLRRPGERREQIGEKN